MQKRLLIFILAFSLLILPSCRKLESGEDTTDILTTDEVTTAHDETTAKTVSDDTTVYEEALPCLIGLYDDLENNGTYTRLYEWNEPWIAGKDIAVFDVIPSAENTLTNSSYKELWISEAEKLPEGYEAKPYFVLEYTLKDKTEKSIEIRSYKDAEKVIYEGYLEVYLYDDIHQEDGVWYYHITEGTVNADSVISSVKLTAGKNVDSVSSITLTVYLDGSSCSSVDIKNGY